MRLAYYPGCVARSTGKEYELSTKAVCALLGIDLEEIDDWSCCGATHASNETLAAGLAARNLARTELPVLTTCSICYSNLRSAVIRLEDGALLNRVNEALFKKYSGGQVRHIIEILRDSLSTEDKKLISVPLKGLKVAPYYGCLLTRPGGGMDSPENPVILEELISTLKATPVSYPYKMLCCGGPVFMPREEATGSSFHILRTAKKAGADVVVVACPLCHLMLDARQHALEARYKEKLGIPILYITQLAGIALGLGPEELGLQMNSVSPMKLVEDIYSRLAVEEQC